MLWLPAGRARRQHGWVALAAAVAVAAVMEAAAASLAALRW